MVVLPNQQFKTLGNCEKQQNFWFHRLEALNICYFCLKTTKANNQLLKSIAFKMNLKCVSSNYKP